MIVKLRKCLITGCSDIIGIGKLIENCFSLLWEAVELHAIVITV